MYYIEYERRGFYMKVWVLKDQYHGSTNQSIALAEMLGLGYETKVLEYNIFASLPNFLKFGFMGLRPHSIEAVTAEAPDLVISAGRRCAAAARALKMKFPSCKIIQILKPGLSLKHYDVLIIPEHDRIVTYKYQNKIIRIHGALCFYPEKQQKLDKDYWEPKFNALNLDKPRISLFIGGVSKKCIFNLNHARSLVEQTIKIAKILGASLLISTSRRTPAKITEFVKDKFSKSAIPHLFYDISSKIQNPYRGFLSTSDYFIVTGDSISMLMDAVETHKPVYIFFKDEMLSAKHKRFVDGCLKSSLIDTLENFTTSSHKTKFVSNSTIKDKVLSLIR